MADQPIRVTALHHVHLALHASMVVEDGWRLPQKYGDTQTEVESTLINVGIYDLSFLRKLDARGRRLLQVFQEELRIPHIKVGNIYQMTHREETNDASFVCVLSERHILIITTEAEVNKIQQALSSLQQEVSVTDITSGLSALQLTGPFSRSVLSKVTDCDLRADKFPNYSCGEWRLADVHTVILRRDLHDILNFILLIPSYYSEYVWSRLLESGKEFSLRPYGLGALKILGGNRHGESRV